MALNFNFQTGGGAATGGNPYAAGQARLAGIQGRQRDLGEDPLTVYDIGDSLGVERPGPFNLKRNKNQIYMDAVEQAMGIRDQGAFQSAELRAKRAQADLYEAQARTAGVGEKQALLQLKQFKADAAAMNDMMAAFPQARGLMAGGGAMASLGLQLQLQKEQLATMQQQRETSAAYMKMMDPMEREMREREGTAADIAFRANSKWEQATGMSVPAAALDDLRTKAIGKMSQGMSVSDVEAGVDALLQQGIPQALQNQQRENDLYANVGPPAPEGFGQGNPQSMAKLFADGLPSIEAGALYETAIQVPKGEALKRIGALAKKAGSSDRATVLKRILAEHGVTSAKQLEALDKAAINAILAEMDKSLKDAPQSAAPFTSATGGRRL